MPESNQPQSFVVLFDLPARQSSAKFYRRLKELLDDLGGSAQCRATQSAYIVSGENARHLAYTLGQLASAFGAGKVGESDGVQVLPLGEIEPRAHFAALQRAEETVHQLMVDRRTVAGKRAPRSITPAPFGEGIIDLTKILETQRDVVRSERSARKVVAR